MGKEKAKKEDAVATAKLCFVIMPIGSEGSEIRQRSDKVFKYIISEVVERMGYRPLRGDHLHKGGRITNQIIELLLDAPLVVADLTGMNPNVVYELAIRHAARKPVVHIGEGTEGLPFDFYDMRMVMFDRHDIGSVHKAKKAIAAQIRTFGETGTVDSPISNALDLKALMEKGDPNAIDLLQVVEALGELRTEIRQLKGDLVGTTKGSLAEQPTLYEMLTGEYPVRSQDASLLRSTMSLKKAIQEAMPDTTEEERKEMLDRVRALSSQERNTVPPARASLLSEILQREKSNE